MEVWFGVFGVLSQQARLGRRKATRAVGLRVTVKTMLVSDATKRTSKRLRSLSTQKLDGGVCHNEWHMQRDEGGGRGSPMVRGTMPRGTREATHTLCSTVYRSGSFFASATPGRISGGGGRIQWHTPHTQTQKHTHTYRHVKQNSLLQRRLHTERLSPCFHGCLFCLSRCYFVSVLVCPVAVPVVRVLVSVPRYPRLSAFPCCFPCCCRCCLCVRCVVFVPRAVACWVVLQRIVVTVFC